MSSEFHTFIVLSKEVDTNVFLLKAFTYKIPNQSKSSSVVFASLFLFFVFFINHATYIQNNDITSIYVL